MEQALPGSGPNWLLRCFIIVSVTLHLVLLIWVSGVVKVTVYNRIKVSMFKERPAGRALPRPRPRPPEPRTSQEVNPLVTPSPSLPVPAQSRAEAPPAAPGEPGLEAAVPRAAALPAGEMAPPTLSMAWVEMEAYQELVRLSVARQKRYPSRSRKRGIEGRAWVIFSIGPKGDLWALRLLKSAGHTPLDTAALEAVRRAAPFPPPPAGTPAEGLAMEIVIAFELY